jgi:hypothetical protein
MEESDKKKQKENLLKFVKYLYIASALGISLINYGSLESILISRNICLVVVIIANIIIIYFQLQSQDIGAKIANISLLVLFIIILITYIYYINKSYSLDKTTNILKNSFSNSFIILFVLLCIYLSYYIKFDMTTGQYSTLLICCSIMICLLYPLIITIIYYKTDGFKNIYI